MLINIAFSALVGLLLGSFASALTWRVPRDIPWTSKDKEPCFSACPECNTRLSVLDLVPLFSWLFLKGKCRHCQKPISCDYPLIELTTMCASIGIVLTWGMSVPALMAVIAMPFLIALIFIDAKHLILPDTLVIAVAVMGGLLAVTEAVLQADEGILIAKALGLVIFGGLAFILRFSVSLVLKKEAMGLGDVKFFACAGLWLGGLYLPSFLIISGLTGIVWGLVHNHFSKTKVFPFGPALIMTFYICILLKGMSIIPFVS